MPRKPRAVLVGAWLFLLATAVYRWRSSLSNPARFADFQPVWHAAGVLLHGGDLYSSGGFGFVYLPSAAVLFLPFRLFSLGSAVSLSIALQLVSLTAACLILVRHFRGNPILVPVSATVLVLSEPTLGAEIHGNIDLFIPLVIAACAVAIDRERDGLAGALYGLSVAMKPLVVIPALIALAALRWRFLVLAAATVATLSLPTALLTSVGGFVHHALPFVASGEPDQIVQVQSTAVASIFRDQSHVLTGALRVACGLLAASTCWRLWRREASVGLRWLETTAAGQLGLALVAGFAYPHHVATVLLLLPAAASGAALSRRPSVFFCLLLLALPRPIPGWTILQQQCAAEALLLVTLGRAARPRSSAVRRTLRRSVASID